MKSTVVTFSKIKKVKYDLASCLLALKKRIELYALKINKVEVLIAQ